MAPANRGWVLARDLNLDQIVAAIAGDREERDFITRVLFAPLHDADAVCYRQEVFQDPLPTSFGKTCTTCSAAGLEETEPYP